MATPRAFSDWDPDDPRAAVRRAVEALLRDPDLETWQVVERVGCTEGQAIHARRKLGIRAPVPLTRAIRGRTDGHRRRGR